MKSLLERLEDKVLIGDGCWEWTAAKDGDGYGILTGCAETRSTKAHRIMYELLVGPIPDDLTIDHLCRVRHCVNPKHMEPVSVVENVMRGTAPPALNATKTHCKVGHSFAEHGNRRSTSKKRYCRECLKLQMRKFRAERRII